jgi:hypothetical protein
MHHLRMPSPERLTVVWFLCIALLLVPQQQALALDDPQAAVLIDSSSTILGSNLATHFDTTAVVSHTSSESATSPTVLIFSPVSIDGGVALWSDAPLTAAGAEPSQPPPILTDWIDAMAAVPALTPFVDDLALPILPYLDFGPGWGPGAFSSGAGIMATPEPTRGLLLAVGLIGLCSVRRRHSSSSTDAAILP